MTYANAERGWIGTTCATARTAQAISWVCVSLMLRSVLASSPQLERVLPRSSQCSLSLERLAPRGGEYPLASRDLIQGEIVCGIRFDEDGASCC